MVKLLLCLKNQSLLMRYVIPNMDYFFIVVKCMSFNLMVLYEKLLLPVSYVWHDLHEP